VKALLCQHFLALLKKADEGTRTPDPLLTMEVLYRLSYVGVVSG
jgi:hypothetical protein